MRTTGFFGLFDILGYSALNENNDLTTLVDIFKKNIIGIDVSAVAMGGNSQFYSFTDVKTMQFSDTIIFYEEPSTSGIEKIEEGITDPSLFMFKACVLLRKAFEGGIPLRGAISYGEYYIHDRAFLGKPIIEAHNFEMDQNWSGAVLCKSAENEFKTRLERYHEKKKSHTAGKEDIRNLSFCNFISPNCFYNYPIPCKKSKRNGLALCWDDSVLYLFGYNQWENDSIPLNKLSKNKTKEMIKLKFMEHHKPIDKKIMRLINNTSEFIWTSKNRLYK